MRKLVIFLVVVAALFVGVDRILVSAAENVVARRLQIAADLEQQPEVSVRGFPFLTQAVSGEYRRIHISMDRVQRDDFSLTRLDAQVRDVRAPLGPMLRRESSLRVRAQSASATAVVPFAVVREKMPDGVKIRRAEDRLRMTGDVTVLGRELSASALVEVSVAEGGRLAFTAQQVNLEGMAAPESLTDRFSFTVKVGELPFGMHLTGVRVTDNGIRVYAAGKDLLLTGSVAMEQIPR